MNVGSPDVTDMAEGRLLAILGPPPSSTSPPWLAARVRSAYAWKVRASLRDAGIEEFLPTYTEEVRWSDRTKTVERALFPGYIFLRVMDVSAALRIAGIVQILASNLKPTPIPSDQIDAVRLVCLSAENVLPCAHVVGESVTVATGPLAGVTGTVKRVKGGLRLIVAIELLGRAISVEIDAADVETL